MQVSALIVLLSTIPPTVSRERIGFLLVSHASRPHNLPQQNQQTGRTNNSSTELNKDEVVYKILQVMMSCSREACWYDMYMLIRYL